MQLARREDEACVSAASLPIVLWYNTNSGQDSTNGNSCVPVFAPSLKATMSTTGDYESAAKLYCGKDAIIALPNPRHSQHL
ncbi:hypothetical protein JCM10207_005891 [Rhodosporidiobolus poonsookiae]